MKVLSKILVILVSNAKLVSASTHSVSEKLSSTKEVEGPATSYDPCYRTNPSRVGVE